MIDEVQALALLEEVNPVPDMDAYLAPVPDVAAYLAVQTEWSSEMTQTDSKPAVEEKRRPLNKWLVAAAVVLVLGIAALLLTRNSNEAPVATVPTQTTVADATPTTIASPPTTAAQAESSETTTSPPTTSPLVAGMVLTIGDQTWELDGARCVAIGGLPDAPLTELVVSHRQGDLEVYVNDDRGGDHVSINNRTGDGTLDWVAEDSSVFILVDGNTVTAEGTFTDLATDLPETEGTLTVTCSEWIEE